MKQLIVLAILLPLAACAVNKEPVRIDPTQAQVGTIQVQVEQITGNVSSVESSISEIQGNITQIQNDITDLQSNSDNFLDSGDRLLQFVGNTSTAIDGSNGVRAMTELCQVNFVESRVCTSEEYAKTFSFPEAIPNTTWSWILPAQLVGSGSGSPNVTYVTDTFAGITRKADSKNDPFSCRGWRTLLGTGLSVSGVGAFSSRSCRNLQQVSCCK